MKKMFFYFIISIIFTTQIDAEDKLSNEMLDKILMEQDETLKYQDSLIYGDGRIKQVPSTKDEKVDRIIKNQEILQQLLKNQNKIYAKVENDPFKDKDFGFEVNIFRLLAAEKDSFALSGTFSLFYPEDQVEIAFPMYVASVVDEWNNDNRFSVATFDVHYRKFLGDTLNGFYISGFVRAAYLEGVLFDYDNYWYYDNPNVEYGSEKKLGVGVGIGYRIFSKSGYYWGTSLSFGRYYIGENDKFDYWEMEGIDDSKYIVDFELLKFGYAF